MRIKLLVLFILFHVFITGCNTINKNKELGNSNIGIIDSSIYSKNNFSEYFLDSISIDVFFKNETEFKTKQNEVFKFYKSRNFQYAWFSDHNLTSTALDFYKQLVESKSDFSNERLYNSFLDTLYFEFSSNKNVFLKNHEKVLKFELLLTNSYFYYSEKTYSGFVNNPVDLEWFIPRMKKNYSALLDTLVSSNNTNGFREPMNSFYLALKKKLTQYRIIQKKGGWPIISSKLNSISLSDSLNLEIVYNYLKITNDLDSNNIENNNSDSLLYALKKFQLRMGLKVTGIIDSPTIDAMNVPVEFRIQQIMVNMERLRWLPQKIEGDFLIVNIPEFKFHVFENGIYSWSSNVVVGKDATQTNIFSGKISNIILNPYWVVPNSIVFKELLPHIIHNSSYLADNHMDVLLNNIKINPRTVNWKSSKVSFPYSIRQRPGNDNPLGKIKFLFPNNFSIYLHDSPAKQLFSLSKRTFSHGCIRLAEAEKLALYLLRNDTTWTKEKMINKINTGAEFSIQLKPAIPVYIVYFTSWVTPTGIINFRNDVYGLDERLTKEIFDKKKLVL